MKESLLLSKRVLDTLLELLVIGVVMVMVVDVLWGVFTRFVLNSPSRWTEEIARLLLMWVALLGAAVAYGRSEHLGFDYFVEQLDPAAKKLLALVSQCIVVAFAMLVMVYGGFVLVTETLAANQVTPALGWKMGYVYLAVPISGIFMVIYGVEQFLGLALDAQRNPTPDQDASIE